MRKILAGIVLAILLSSTAVPVYGDSLSDLGNLSIQETQAQAQLDSLNKQMSDLDTQVSAAQSDSDNKEAELASKQHDLDSLNSQVASMESQLQDQAVALYISGGGLTDLNPFTSDYPDKLMAKKEYQQLAVQTKVVTENQLKTKQNQAKAEKEAVEKLAAQAQAALNQITADKAQLQQAVDQQTQIEQQTEAEIQQIVAHYQSPGDVSGATLGWPLPTITVTSPFGPRIHPILGTVIFHEGVDLAANMGDPIFAPADGTVIIAGTVSGYGNYTCIDHGGGLSTCYGHQSQLLVKVGDQVKKGQIIGLIGSTGLSTGPHLHFEVRINGAPVDPLPYLGVPPVQGSNVGSE